MEVYNILQSEGFENKKDCVLVRVENFNNLRKIYPNYFIDIDEFNEIIESYIN